MNSYSTSWWSLLLIYRPREDERLSWPCWLTYSGRFIHINGYQSAAGPVQTSESLPIRDRRSTTKPPMPGAHIQEFTVTSRTTVFTSQTDCTKEQSVFVIVKQWIIISYEHNNQTVSVDNLHGFFTHRTWNTIHSKLKENATLKIYGLKWTLMCNKVTYIAWKWQFSSNKEDVWRQNLHVSANSGDTYSHLQIQWETRPP